MSIRYLGVRGIQKASGFVHKVAKHLFPWSSRVLQIPSALRQVSDLCRMSSVKLVIDTDPGVDDAMALAIALTSPNVEVLGITCVAGNVNIEQCCKNVLKILHICDRADVPVYKGAERPLLGDIVDATFYHGNDGLADCGHHAPEFGFDKISDTPASLAVINFAKKYPNEITLVAIGPLTNLALAVHLCPLLPQLLKKVVILGGNYTSLGNMTATGEFNFFCDPEAAHVVLKQYTCPIEIVPWELILNQPVQFSFWQKYCNQVTKRGEFFGKLVKAMISKWNDPNMPVGDGWAVAQAIDPSMAIEKSDYFATVETKGDLARGMMVVDRRPRGCKEKQNITLITRADKEKLQKFLFQSVV